MQQCLAGNNASYRLLYDRYAKAMFNTALRILNQVADAEDVLQEAFSDAFRQLPSFENRSTFGAWLKQIVIFKSIACVKKRNRNLVELEQVPESLVDEREEEQDLSYTVALIRQALEELPDGYRTVLSLYLFEGYDQEEIAEILSVAPSTVRSQYIRAKKKLVDLIKSKAVYER